MVSALRMDRVDTWPGDGTFTSENKTDPGRFLNRAAFDTYMVATWVAALTTLLFGVFKCRSFAEVSENAPDTLAQMLSQDTCPRRSCLAYPSATRP